MPEEVKDTTRRNHLFEDARVAAVRGDLTSARAKTAAYVKATEIQKRPFEVRQHHELAGLIALAEKKYDTAAAEFSQANQQDPRILYLTAVALKGTGDGPRAAAMATRAAKFNGLGFNYAYVRTKAAKIGS